MKSFNTKLVLSVLGVAMLATPVLAQPMHHHRAPATLYNYQAPGQDPVGVYPNPVVKSGSAEQVQSGAAWDLDNGS